MERISYKTIIIALLTMLAVLSAAHTLIAKQQYHDAALRAQAASLTRIVEIASDESLSLLHDKSFVLVNSLQSRLIDKHNKQLLAKSKLRYELDATFTKYVSGAHHIDLVKLRVYDMELNLIEESSRGVHSLIPGAPSFMRELASQNKFKASRSPISRLWLFHKRPLYSLLVPIGGLRHTGYLEVVADPLYDLSTIAAMTKLPIQIKSSEGLVLFSSPSLPITGRDEFLPVEYLLRDDDEKPLYLITTYLSTRLLQSDLQGTLFNSSITYIMMIIAILMMVIYLLDNLLFQPVSHLVDGVQQSIEGNCDARIDEHGVKEVHHIARAFNAMAQTLRCNLNELTRLSLLDGLTGIANRRAFDQLMELEWTRALRHNTPLAMLLIDIDNFKAYNDSMGHQAGDQCLREVAQILQGEMKRPGDTVARYGGEEFGIILPDTDIFGAGVVALNIRNKLQSRAIPHPASETAAVVTLSIGINVTTPTSTDSIQTFINGSDRALYLVKNHGRNNICVADEAAKEPRCGNLNSSETSLPQ